MEKITIEKSVKKIKIPALGIAVALFCILLNLPIFDNPQAQKALAVLVMVAVPDALRVIFCVPPGLAV